MAANSVARSVSHGGAAFLCRKKKGSKYSNGQKKKKCNTENKLLPKVIWNHWRSKKIY